MARINFKHFELFPESESQFFLKVADVEVTFVKDDKGQVIHIDIHSNGQDLRARRIKQSSGEDEHTLARPRGIKNGT